jgi:hypothetical protein
MSRRSSSDAKRLLRGYLRPRHLRFLALLLFATKALSGGSLSGKDIQDVFMTDLGARASLDSEYRVLSSLARPSLRLHSHVELEMPVRKLLLSSHSVFALLDDGRLASTQLPLQVDWQFTPHVSSMDLHADTLLFVQNDTLHNYHVDAWTRDICTHLGDALEHLALSPSLFCASNPLHLFCHNLLEPDAQPQVFELPDCDVQELVLNSERLLLCLGDAGLLTGDMTLPAAPVFSEPMHLGFPALDAVHLQSTKFFVAAGEAGLYLLDLSDATSPAILQHWNHVKPAYTLSRSANHLLVGQGPKGARRYRIDNAEALPGLQKLDQYRSRPQVTRLFPCPYAGMNRQAILLDSTLGFTQIEFHSSDEEIVSQNWILEQPLPITSGHLRDELLASCAPNAGLRFYERQEADGALPSLLGIHSSDPVHLFAWGPEHRMVYVTTSGFLAFKQANLDPWFLYHHGLLPLGTNPKHVCWVEHHLFVADDSGQLFHVDAENELAPSLLEIINFDATITDLTAGTNGDEDLLICADDLVLGHLLENGYFEILATAGLASGAKIKLASYDAVQVGLLATDAPSIARFHYDGSALLLGAETPMQSAVRAIARDEDFDWVSLESGDILLLDDDEVQHDVPPWVPASFDLQSYPNPFNPICTLQFTLRQPASVHLRVYDLLGTLQQEVTQSQLPAGLHTYPFDGSKFSSGLFIAHLDVDGESAFTKMILLK